MPVWCDNTIHLVDSFQPCGIHFKAFELGIAPITAAGKFLLSIFASLTEYDWESLWEKTKAGQQLAAAQGQHIGQPKGLVAEYLALVRKARENGLSFAETVELIGISHFGVTRYRKLLQTALTQGLGCHEGLASFFVPL